MSQVNFIELNNEQQEIMNACKQVFSSIQNDFERQIAKKIVQRGITRKHGNYLDIYPIVTAYLLDECVQILNGASGIDTIRDQKRQAHKLMDYTLKV